MPGSLQAVRRLDNYARSVAQPPRDESTASTRTDPSPLDPSASDSPAVEPFNDPSVDADADIASRSSFQRRLWMVVALALVVRLIWVVFAARQPQGLTDMTRYLAAARDIALGKGYIDFSTAQPTTYYPPGYPIFIGAIAFVMRPFGSFEDRLPYAIAVVQAFLGAGSVYFLGRLGRSLWSAKAGLIAALGLALYPNLVMHTSGVLSETFYIFLILASLHVLLAVPFESWTGRQAWLRAGGFGVLFGMAALVRPIALPAVGVLVVIWLRGRTAASGKDGPARGWSRASAMRWSAVAVVATLAVVGAWTVRNTLRMNQVVLISTNTGDNLCIGHSSQATGGFHLRPGCVAVPGDTTDGTAAEVAHDKELTKRSIRWTIEHPGEEPRLMVSRIYQTFHADDDAVMVVQDYQHELWLSPLQEGALRIAANVAYVVVGIGGLVALLWRREWWRGPRRQMFVWTMLVMAVVPLAFFGEPRFKVPVIPFLIVLAAGLFGPPDTVLLDDTVPLDDTVLLDDTVPADDPMEAR